MKILIIIDSLLINGVTTYLFHLTDAFIKIGQSVKVVVLNKNAVDVIPPKCEVLLFDNNIDVDQLFKYIKSNKFNLILCNLNKSCKLGKILLHNNISNVQNVIHFKVKDSILYECFENTNVICPSIWIKKYVSNKISANIKHIYNPVNMDVLNIFYNVKMEHLNDYLLQCNRIVDNKGIGYLIKLYKKYNIYQPCLCIGLGNKYQKTREHIKKYKLNIKMLGKKIFPYYYIKHTTVVLQLAVLEEVLGYLTLESLYLNKIVFAFDSLGANEILNYLDMNYLIVPQGDLDRLYQNIKNYKKFKVNRKNFDVFDAKNIIKKYVKLSE